MIFPCLQCGGRKGLRDMFYQSKRGLASLAKQELRQEQHKCHACILCNNEHALDIPSESANLCIIREQVKIIGEHCNLSSAEIFDLQVAVGEAAANAIEHGSPCGITNKIEFRVICDDGSLVVSIKDEGKFLKRVPLQDDVEISFRGRGIPLMLALMDSVTIDEAEDGTAVILTKRIAFSNPCRFER